MVVGFISVTGFGGESKNQKLRLKVRYGAVTLSGDKTWGGKPPNMATSPKEK